MIDSIFTSIIGKSNEALIFFSNTTNIEIENCSFITIVSICNQTS